MANYNYTNEELVEAIIAARVSHLPWAHILANEIDKLTIELAFRSKTEERKSRWETPWDQGWKDKYTLAGLSENKENE